MFMTVLLSLVLPILAGGGVIALSWLLPPLRKWKWLSGAAFGVALAVGVFGSFASENGLPVFPPSQKAQWLAFSAIFAGAFAILMPFTGEPGSTRSWPMLELVAICVGGLVAKAPFIAAMVAGKSLDAAQPMFSDSTVSDQIALGLVIALGIVALDRVVAARPGFLMPLVFGISFGGLAPLADAAGWITLTFLAVTASMISFVAAFAAAFGGAPTIGRGGLAAALVLLAIFPMAGHRQTYGDFPWWCWGLVVASPSALLWFEIPIFGKLPAWAGNTLRILAVIAMVGGAVLIATGGGEDSSGSDGGSPFGDYSDG
ncbi:MAG: hypothetical protein CMJ23_06510 [Phycisphaerae bacterium]|nr:hypothetical protein [Phycisphaerae bacterium]